MLPMLDIVFSENFWTISEIARKYSLSRQAVYVAIKSEKLPANKEDAKHWKVKEGDVKEWRGNRYKRKNSKRNGEFLFGNGWLSVNDAAKFLKVKSQKLYYLMRSGKHGFKFDRIGGSYRIRDTDLKDFVNSHMRMFKRRKEIA